MESRNKYKSQQNYIRKNYVRFPLDLKPETLDLFKKACEKCGTTPTTEIKRFIADFIVKAKKE